MHLPSMTTRRWMVFVAIAEADFMLIVQEVSHPLAYLVFMATLAAVILSPALLLPFMLA
jgi:hypothetical protein